MNKKLIIGIGVVVLLLTILGFTYAFFTTTVTGEGADQTVTTGKLELVYTDGPEIIMNNGYPGDKVEKIFTVTNTGTQFVNYTMWWKELTNTITGDELVLSLECKSYKNYNDENLKEESGICKGISEEIIASDATLPFFSNISIDEGITHEYKMIVLFKEMNKNQNYNQGKVFSGKINIKDEYVTLIENYTLENKVLTATLIDNSGIDSYALTYLTADATPEDEKWVKLNNVTKYELNVDVASYKVKLWLKNITGNITSYDLTPNGLLTVDPNGGTWNGSTEKQTYNMLYDETKEIAAPTRENGYTFVNWEVTTDGTDSSISGTTFIMGEKDTTLTAQWTNQYKITFNNQSATTAGTTSTTATYGSAMPAITVPAKTGYTFGGYFTSTGGSGTQYYTAAGASARVWNLTSATTLYAKWTANTYTVTLNNQSATTAGSTSTTATYASAMKTITVPKKTGYTFGGYYTSTGCSGTQYYTAAGASARAWAIASNTTLYACWKPVLLTAKVKQGDYVLYYGSNGCTNTSYCNSSATTSNWRVAYIANSSVYLISAASLEEIAYQGTSAAMISAINTAALKYCNTTYAYGAACNGNSGFNIDNPKFLTMVGSSSGCFGVSSTACGLNHALADLTTRYCIATYSYTNSSGVQEVMHWNPTSNIVSSGGVSCYLRPMVRLNTDVRWTGVGSGTSASPYRIAR